MIKYLIVIFLCLLFFLFFVASRDSEVSQLVGVLTGGNNTEVVTELLLLQVTLGKVLKLTLGEAKVRRECYGELGAITADDNTVGSKVVGLAVYLDTILKVLLERSNIKNLIIDGSCAVNHELDSALLSRLGSLFSNERRSHR